MVLEQRVSTLAEPPRISVAGDTVASALLEALADGGWALVREQGRVLGLVDAADVRRAQESAVASVARAPTWLAPDSGLTRAWALAEASGARALALGDGDSLTGIVDVQVLARALARAHVAANRVLAERMTPADSERRATEEALRELGRGETVRELLRGLTHHLNNLGTSLDFLANAASGSGNVVDPGLLPELRDDASSCRRFARDLLALSRHGGVIRPEEKLGEAIAATHELLACERPLRVELELEETLAASTFRREEITAIVANLIDEGLRAAQASMPPLRVRVQARWLPDGDASGASPTRPRVELVVEEEGPARGDETRAGADGEPPSSRARSPDSRFLLAREIVRACAGEWSVVADAKAGRRVRVVLGAETEPQT